MRHIDRWYHRNDINHCGKVNDFASSIHTDSLPYFYDENSNATEPNITDYFASIDESRVIGYRYVPYKQGSHLWKEKANQRLASIAQDNFQCR